jgi:hypothetical protein
MTDLNDPRAGHSTYRLLHITRGEPDPALFQVPADYTLMPVGVRNGDSCRALFRGRIGLLHIDRMAFVQRPGSCIDEADRSWLISLAL